MPVITKFEPFDGVVPKANRLGLEPLVQEVRAVLEGFQLLVKEEKDSNGTGGIRKLIDARFESFGGWHKTSSGDIDWKKCLTYDGASVCIGVEVQVSGRSDLIAVDLIHLKNNLTDGRIDIGMLIVPDDELSRYLTGRTPNYREAIRHLQNVKVEDIPLYLVAFKHDGPGESLEKQRTRS